LELWLRVKSSSAGNYRLRLSALPSARPDDEKRIIAEKAYLAVNKLRGEDTAPSLSEASAQFEKVLSLWREVDDRQVQARTLHHMSDVQLALRRRTRILQNIGV
jgi:hypothetical protein